MSLYEDLVICVENLRSFVNSQREQIGTTPRFTATIKVPIPPVIYGRDSLIKAFVQSLHEISYINTLSVNTTGSDNGHGMFVILVEGPCGFVTKTFHEDRGIWNFLLPRRQVRVTFKICEQGDIRASNKNDTDISEELSRAIKAFNAAQNKVKIHFLTFHDSLLGGSRYFNERGEFDKVAEDLRDYGPLPEYLRGWS